MLYIFDKDTNTDNNVLPSTLDTLDQYEYVGQGNGSYTLDNATQQIVAQAGGELELLSTAIPVRKQESTDPIQDVYFETANISFGDAVDVAVSGVAVLTRESLSEMELTVYTDSLSSDVSKAKPQRKALTKTTGDFDWTLLEPKEAVLIAGPRKRSAARFSLGKSMTPMVRFRIDAVPLEHPDTFEVFGILVEQPTTGRSGGRHG